MVSFPWLSQESRQLKQTVLPCRFCLFSFAARNAYWLSLSPTGGRTSTALSVGPTFQNKFSVGLETLNYDIAEFHGLSFTSQRLHVFRHLPVRNSCWVFCESSSMIFRWTSVSTKTIVHYGNSNTVWFKELK